MPLSVSRVYWGCALPLGEVIPGFGLLVSSLRSRSISNASRAWLEEGIEVMSGSAEPC